MSFWNDIDGFLGQSNPANAAMPYLNQIPGMLQGYMNPFIQHGNWAGNQLQNQYGQLTSNPGGFINQMGQGFQQSPGYAFARDQAMGGVDRAAAAGGMAGSPEEQQNMAGVVTGMANQDYYNWMNHAMGAYQQGLNGMQNMYGIGMNAANDLSSNLANTYMSQANLAYSGANSQNQMNSGILGGLFGMGDSWLMGRNNNQQGNDGGLGIGSFI